MKKTNNYEEQFERLVVEVLYIAADSKDAKTRRVLRRAAAILYTFNKALLKVRSDEEKKKKLN